MKSMNKHWLTGPSWRVPLDATTPCISRWKSPPIGHHVTQILCPISYHINMTSSIIIHRFHSPKWKNFHLNTVF